jgi:dodecin
LTSESARDTRVPSSVAAGVKWSQSEVIPSDIEFWEVIVAGTVARVTEISARSDTSFEDAVNAGLARANATLRGVKSAWIKEQSVDVENGEIVAYRVNMLVTFVLE